MPQIRLPPGVRQSVGRSRAAGFSTTDRLVRPVVADGPYGFESVNVDDQLREPSSLLRWMLRMIRIRKECPEIGDGEWRILGRLGYEWYRLD